MPRQLHSLAAFVLIHCLGQVCLTAAEPALELRDHDRVALVGGSLAERMNLYGHFETLLHSRFPGKQLVVRNFGWPADEVGLQQRPSNYTKIDDPMAVFAPDVFLCFFGFNEHFSGDSPDQIAVFQDRYREWIQESARKASKGGSGPRFVLISPIAFERMQGDLLPDGQENNRMLQQYTEAVAALARELKIPFVDLFTPTRDRFNNPSGPQFTINGIHLNEAGDRLVASLMDQQLFPQAAAIDMDSPEFAQLRRIVNDKSWLHLQDYRMLNGWYVYGGRRTWDTETFPTEFHKIRNMVAVRDQYLWDLASGKQVPAEPDDSQTGEVFIPETMFGTRDEKFRQNREPKTLVYPTPEESISQMTVPDGFEVRLFASERDFPELAKPTQMAFDSKGRLWVSCMINYPQWLPGTARPGDRLLILEDTDKDGRADVCKTFYDRLICPTGFEFHEDGVLVVDQPRILFLRDTDGDDQADDVTYVIDGIATDDTHHTMGAWEWSHGGQLHTLEGVSMSTTMETPWGPFRSHGPSGGYIIDPLSWKVRHFRTPGYGNPWCLVFDQWGVGFVGDGTNAQQHWLNPLSGYEVSTRRTLEPNFDNQGMRPAVGNEFLYTRHFPDDVQGQFLYACVINMHGLPRFEVGDDPQSAGFRGKRIQDLISSTDNFFRPVDPQIGPDGALWFGDWCNALIGHMQYSQRDPNRDHVHGRIYRLVYPGRPLLDPVLQDGKPIEALLDQLTAYELRTRYRARRELRTRDSQDVLAAVNQWIQGDVSANQLCEALWMQESFRQVDPALVAKIMSSDDFHARAAAVHVVANEIDRYSQATEVFRMAIQDPHPRVRLEAVRGLSFVRSPEALAIALEAVDQPLDYWIEYTLEHTLHALKPLVPTQPDQNAALANVSQQARNYWQHYLMASGPGGKAILPLKAAQDSDAGEKQRQSAIRDLARIRGGNAKNGSIVFERTCAGCHQIGDRGREFGPRLDDVGARFQTEELITHILLPNEKIAKGFETVQLVLFDGRVMSGFVVGENDKSLKLGVATQDGKGMQVDILLEDIEERREMKASSMPEGLANTIAPSEFIDLIEFLGRQKTPIPARAP